jgi:hypothetical protein
VLAAFNISREQIRYEIALVYMLGWEKRTRHSGWLEEATPHLGTPVPGPQ